MRCLGGRGKLVDDLPYRRALVLLDAPPSPLQRIHLPTAVAHDVETYLKRDELLDERISGNKWRKLVPQVAWLLRGGAVGLASVGGWHSNHLAALAALGQRLGVPTLGFVGGWDGTLDSYTTAFAKTCGMSLRSVSRGKVRAWREGGVPTVLPEGYAWIPEGGSARLGLMGMRSLVREVEMQVGAVPEAYWVSVGSGGTVAGLARATHVPVHGVMCVRDAGLAGRIGTLALEATNLHLHRGALGGFASGEPAIAELMQRFEVDNPGVRLDPVYTAKLVLGYEAWLAAQAATSVDQRHVLVHTGGLQGRPAWEQRWARSG